MLGLLTKSSLARSALIVRHPLTRRMGVQSLELPKVSGNLVLIAGIGLAAACGSFLGFSGMVMWGTQPDKYLATKKEE